MEMSSAQWRPYCTGGDELITANFQSRCVTATYIRACNYTFSIFFVNDLGSRCFECTGSYNNLGDAGWKLCGEVRKRPTYLNWEFANIYYNSASRNQVEPFIHWDTFQHTRFSCEFLQMLQLIPKYPTDIKELKERRKDIYAVTFTLFLRSSRRSDEKNI